MNTRSIYCVECAKEVDAFHCKGSKTYPHREDLHSLNFWMCPNCSNFVGVHSKGLGKKPLGCIANKEMKNARIKIHGILDPIWKSKKMSRSDCYKKISDFLGYEYHTAEIKTIDEARRIYRFILGGLKNESIL